MRPLREGQGLEGDVVGGSDSGVAGSEALGSVVRAEAGVSGAVASPGEGAAGRGEVYRQSEAPASPRRQALAQCFDVLGLREVGTPFRENVGAGDREAGACHRSRETGSPGEKLDEEEFSPEIGRRVARPAPG